MVWERYRIWLKDDTYEVAVAQNRDQAVAIAVNEKGVDKSQIVKVGKATSRGRLFNYPWY